MPTLSMLPNKYFDPHYTIRKIRIITQYIDANGSVCINKVPPSRINAMLLHSLKDSDSFSDNDIFNPYDASLFYCFSVFHHIYLNHYREYNFASLDNCQVIFIEFQRFLWEIATAYKRHGGWIRGKLPDLKLFDLKNTSDHIDEITRWKKEMEVGQI